MVFQLGNEDRNFTGQLKSPLTKELIQSEVQANRVVQEYINDQDLNMSVVKAEPGSLVT